jgi:hypothetical protein
VTDDSESAIAGGSPAQAHACVSGPVDQSVITLLATVPGGHAGGEVVAAGTPEQIVACKASQTGSFLKTHLQR